MYFPGGNYYLKLVSSYNTQITSVSVLMNVLLSNNTVILDAAWDDAGISSYVGSSASGTLSGNQLTIGGFGYDHVNHTNGALEITMYLDNVTDITDNIRSIASY